MFRRMSPGKKLAEAVPVKIKITRITTAHSLFIVEEFIGLSTDNWFVTIGQDKLKFQTLNLLLL